MSRTRPESGIRSSLLPAFGNGRSRAPHGLVTGAIVSALAIGACHAPQPPQTGLLQRASADDSAQRPVVRTESPFVSRQPATTRDAASFMQLLEGYPEAQQTVIKTWYAKYAPAAMAFTSNAQWQWMQQRDYPTPDDVLRAAGMSDDELRELAIHGDLKADYFHLARLLDASAQRRNASMLPGQSGQDLEQEMTGSMNRALASGSAFAGYLYGAYYTSLHGDGSAQVGAACGFAWARSRGDARATFTNPGFSTGFAGASGVAAAENYYDMIAAAARINSNFLSAYRGRGDPLIPIGR